MEKTDLIILVADKPVELYNASPKKIIKFFLDVRIEFDCLILSNSSSVEVFVLKTFNTKQRHDGEWRRIFFLQGMQYTLEEISFLHFNLDTTPERVVIFIFKKYFTILERRLL